MKKYSKYISYTLLIIWCVVIFYLSSQTSNVSGSNSLNILSYVFGHLNLDILMSLNVIFRELMHAGVFFVLGILTYNSLRHDFTKVFVYSLLFCVLYSLSDEIHQLFVNGRAFELIDLVLDIFGSLVGIYLAKLERSLHIS